MRNAGARKDWLRVEIRCGIFDFEIANRLPHPSIQRNPSGFQQQFLIPNSSFIQHPSSMHAPGMSIATSTATNMEAGTPVLTMSLKL